MADQGMPDTDNDEVQNSLVGEKIADTVLKGSIENSRERCTQNQAHAVSYG